MPLDGHPEDCACCVRLTFGGRGQKRPRTNADLDNFLPPEAEEFFEEEGGEESKGEEEEEGEERDEEQESEEAEANLIHSTLFTNFDKHVDNLDAARVRRVEILSFKSALEDDGAEETNPDATQDEIDGLGIWQAGDERQGDVNFRTLLKLLTRVDQRGFERCVCTNLLGFSHALRAASLRFFKVSPALLSTICSGPSLLSTSGGHTSTTTAFPTLHISLW